eukprot:scaffold2971_cov274-Pinguiococcus_pyrenoidosus.AAC.1
MLETRRKRPALVKRHSAEDTKVSSVYAERHSYVPQGSFFKVIPACFAVIWLGEWLCKVSSSLSAHVSQREQHSKGLWRELHVLGGEKIWKMSVMSQPAPARFGVPGEEEGVSPV